MLYITTRSDSVAFSEYHALRTNTSEDGGYFVPFCFPKFSKEDIISLQNKSYGEIVADILNRFFAVQLSGWDIDLCIGRNTARIASVGSKIYVAEMWHNPMGDLNFATNSLFKRILGTADETEPSQWFKIAVQIAYLFGLYGELCRLGVCSGGSSFDLSVIAADMITPIAACHARDMGLPVHMIIITSENNSLIWDLIHHGEINTAGADTSVVAGIERLIHCKAGFEATAQFATSISNKRTFFVAEEIMSSFGNGMFGVVLGTDRSKRIMNSYNRSNRYILEPSSAVCVSGLQDYRAKTGVNNITLIISNDSPSNHIDEISAATGLDEQLIMEYIVRS